MPATEEGASEGGTGAAQKEEQETNSEFGKGGVHSLGSRGQRGSNIQRESAAATAKASGGAGGRHGLTTSSSAGCPSGSESGHVGSLFPIIVRAKGVYPVCLGSSSTGTLCSPAGTHLQLQA